MDEGGRSFVGLEARKVEGKRHRGVWGGGAVLPLVGGGGPPPLVRDRRVSCGGARDRGSRLRSGLGKVTIY